MRHLKKRQLSMSSLIKKVQNTIFEHDLIPRGSKIILACSGGPDSAALLDILSKLQKKYFLEIVIAHVNYGLRGSDSNKDEEFVRKLAEKYNLSVFVYNASTEMRFTAPEIKTKTQLIASSQKNISENKLRDIRYAFFEKTRKELGFDLIAIGHTLDDQVETFLMRIIRGSGLSGLSAILYKNNKIIRPLLNIPKSDIIDYLKKNKQTYRIDRTNLKPQYFRNKIRNQLIPSLLKYNPKIKQTVFDATESIREDYDFIKNCAKKEFQKNKNLSIKKLLALHPSIQKQVLLETILEKKSDLSDIEYAHIKELLKIIKSTKNKSQIVIFKGLKAIRKGDKITVEKS